MMSPAPVIDLVLGSGLGWASDLLGLLDKCGASVRRVEGNTTNDSFLVVAANAAEAATLCQDAKSRSPARPLLLLLDLPGEPPDRAALSLAGADSVLLWPCAPVELDTQLTLLARLTSVSGITGNASAGTPPDVPERLRATLAATDVGSWYWYPEVGHIFPDGNLARLFGLDETPEGIALETFVQRMHPEDRPVMEAAIRHSLSHGSDFDQEYRVVRPDGTTRWLHSRGQSSRASPQHPLLFAGVTLDVTARRMAQAAQLEAECLFNTLQAANPNGFMMFRALRDSTGKIVDFDCTYSNPGADRIIGQGACRGRRLLEFTPGNRESGLFDAYVEVTETGKPWRNEFYYGADGLDCWFSTTAVRAGDGFAVTFTDITERKLAEKRAAEEHSLLDAVLEACPAGIVVAKANGELVHINPANDRLWGPAPRSRSVEEYREWKGWWADGSERHGRRIEPHEWAMARALRGETQAEGDVIDIEPFDAPGTRRTMINHGAPVRDPQGRVIGGVVVQTDVTEWRRTEEELRRSEESFRRLSESMPQLVWVADAEGAVQYYNHRAQDFSGIRPRPDGGWDWQPVLHPEDERATLAAWSHALKTGEAYQAEHRLKMADGSYRWHLSRAFSFDSPYGTRQWFGTATDIDTQKRHQEILEHMVQQRTASLQTALAELETFSYSLAHDMRAPLRALVGFSQILIEDYQQTLDAGGQDMLRRIVAAATRMDQLICDVLCYSKIARSQSSFECVDLRALLAGIIETYPMLHKQCADISVEPTLPPVEGNAAMLLQIFSNLFGNAVKFVAPGQRPQVRVFARDASPGRVRIYIKDNGIGIAPEYHQRIFNIFQRLQTSYEGTGIGLAIVQKAAERLGGSVGLKSAPGQGTTFWVELRRAGPQETGAGGGTGSR